MTAINPEQKKYLRSMGIFLLVFCAICAVIVGIFALIFMVLAPNADKSMPLILLLSLVGVVLVIVLIAMLMATFQDSSAGATPGWKRTFGCLEIACMLLCLGGSILCAVVACNTIGVTYEAGDFSQGHYCDICYMNPADGGRAISRPSMSKEDEKVIYYCKAHFDAVQKETSGKPGAGASDFTNKYGTPSTICAHAGCNKTIAKSGDTNCCTTHSNKCGNCRCYIDEDALFCMSCISEALE